MRIESDRLIITDFTMDMAEDVQKGSLDEDNRRFVPDEVFETIDDARETLEFLIGVYESGDGPRVHPILLKNGEYIGYVQAVPMDDEKWEIGYHIVKKHTGCGYASEAVSSFLPVIMRQIGINNILGVCLAENAASARVLEKCGFKKFFDGVDVYHGEDNHIFKYTYRME